MAFLFDNKNILGQEGEKKESSQEISVPQQSNKTEVNAAGVPIVQEETSPSDFTIPENQLTGSADTGVTTATAAIDNDRWNVENLQKENAAQEEDRKYREEHPWVMEDDLSILYDKYKDKTPGQMLYDISQYRNKTGKPLTESEMYMIVQGRDPNRTKKSVTKEKRTAYWADALNQLGNVLAHAYNYGRAQGGSPAAAIPNSKSGFSERLQAADAAMRQRGYNDYVNALAAEQKRKEGIEDMQRKHQMAIDAAERRAKIQEMLKQHEWTSPKYQKELLLLDNKIETAQIQKELTAAKKYYQDLVNKGYPEKQAAEVASKKVYIALTNKRLHEDKDSGKKYRIKGSAERYSSPYQAYQRALILFNKKNPNAQLKLVDSKKFDKKPNEYLEQVGVEVLD